MSPTYRKHSLQQQLLYQHHRPQAIDNCSPSLSEGTALPYLEGKHSPHSYRPEESSSVKLSQFLNVAMRIPTFTKSRDASNIYLLKLYNRPLKTFTLC